MRTGGQWKGGQHRPASPLPWLLLAWWMLGPCSGIRAEGTAPDTPGTEATEITAGEKGGETESAGRKDGIPRFAVNSPFAAPYESPIPKKQKRIWAASRLWRKAPELVVEKWLGPEPECGGKFLLIEFWATWCSQCRLAIPKLNAFQRRFADDLVVIGISDEDEATVRQMITPRIAFSLAIDTEGRMKNELLVQGIPHVIVVEPGGHVVWEGFPLLGNHELTGNVLAAIIAAKPRDRPPEQPKE